MRPLFEYRGFGILGEAYHDGFVCGCGFVGGGIIVCPSGRHLHWRVPQENLQYTILGILGFVEEYRESRRGLADELYPLVNGLLEHASMTLEGVEIAAKIYDKISPNA